MTMQTMTSKEAQTHFGRFAREAQRDSVLITSHGQPTFITMPARINAEVAERISKISTQTGEQAEQSMRKFFKDLEARRPKNPDFTEDEINALIKSAND
jgi:GH25 family lysozyme M1 (1,4-beta-N-acetylmuramidase)